MTGKTGRNEEKMRYEEFTIEGRNAVIEAFRSGKPIDLNVLIVHINAMISTTTVVKQPQIDQVNEYYL